MSGGAISLASGQFRLFERWWKKGEKGTHLFKRNKEDVPVLVGSGVKNKCVPFF
jgi:hypothetical protein